MRGQVHQLNLQSKTPLSLDTELLGAVHHADFPPRGYANDGVPTLHSYDYPRQVVNSKTWQR
jgi:hypothetical protein